MAGALSRVGGRVGGLMARKPMLAAGMLGGAGYGAYQMSKLLGQRKNPGQALGGTGGLIQRNSNDVDAIMNWGGRNPSR